MCKSDDENLWKKNLLSTCEENEKKPLFMGIVEPFDAMKFKRFLDRMLVVNRIPVSRHRFLKYVYLHDDDYGKKVPASA